MFNCTRTATTTPMAAAVKVTVTAITLRYCMLVNLEKHLAFDELVCAVESDLVRVMSDGNCNL